MQSLGARMNQSFYRAGKGCRKGGEGEEQVLWLRGSPHLQPITGRQRPLRDGYRMQEPCWASPEDWGPRRGWELPAQHLSSPRAPEPGRGGGERRGQARLSREDSNPRAGKATALGSGCSPWVRVIFSCLCILEE